MLIDCVFVLEAAARAELREAAAPQPARTVAGGIPRWSSKSKGP